MLYKFCNRCGKKIPQGSKCSCAPKVKPAKRDENDEGQKVYKTFRWKKLSKIVRSQYSNIDIYAYYKYNRLIQTNMVHHIIPVKEDPSLAYDIDNLIPLSNKSHREIESRYRRSQASKEHCIKELRKMKKRWGEGR